MQKHRKPRYVTFKYNSVLTNIQDLAVILPQIILWAVGTITIAKRFSTIKISTTATNEEIDIYLAANNFTNRIEYKEGKVKLSSFIENYDNLL